MEKNNLSKTEMELIIKSLEGQIISLENKIDSLQTYLEGQNEKLDTVISLLAETQSSIPRAFQGDPIVGSASYTPSNKVQFPERSSFTKSEHLTPPAKTNLTEFQVSEAREHDIEEIIWKTALENNTMGHYQDYLDKFPNGIYSQEAQERKNNLQGDSPQKEPSMMEKLDEAFWRLSYAKDSIEAYEEYLEEYPEGQYSWKAAERIKELKDE